MEKIYRLTPTLHDNLWGGNRLREYGKTSDKDRIAESWELSFVPGNEAKTEDGRTTTEAFPRETWGKNCEKFEFFPVLTKFIDAREKLSVQVHPDDEYALKNEGQYGKTEMWYVVDKEGDDAGLYMGLNAAYSKEEFSRAVADGTVESLLGRVDVAPGDVWFIPSRTVHAILGGDLIFEIQQNSTLTYRLYDYMRRDKDGNLRPLHVEKAIDVSCLTRSPELPKIGDGDDELLATCQYFTVRRLRIHGAGAIKAGKDSFRSLMVTEGEGVLQYEGGALSFRKGDSILIPAQDGEFQISGECELIQSTVN